MPGGLLSSCSTTATSLDHFGTFLTSSCTTAQTRETGAAMSMASRSFVILRSSTLVRAPHGTPGQPAPRRMLGALRHRNYRLFLAGQIISTIGTWMQSVAMPWLALQLTHSGLLVGLVLAAQFLPVLLGG